jgi:hypothetical protein
LNVLEGINKIKKEKQKNGVLFMTKREQSKLRLSIDVVSYAITYSMRENGISFAQI